MSAVFLFAACATRHIEVTSEPAGATVFLNDVEIGRTPTRTRFTYYGVYDVLLVKDGYEPLRTHARARAPLHEYPPVDLAAAAWPGGTDSVVRWQFTLEPALETTLKPEDLDAALLDRARALRAE